MAQYHYNGIEWSLYLTRITKLWYSLDWADPRDWRD